MGKTEPLYLSTSDEDATMLPMFLGIDISKDWFDAALLQENNLKSDAPARVKPTHKRFPNNARGFEQLLNWLKNHKAFRVHACLEATGTYGEALAAFLHEQGHTVSVVNPAQIYHFVQTSLSRTKTDKADAAQIARFCQLHQPEEWTPPAPEIRTLQALVRRLGALLETRQSEKNRRAAGPLVAEVTASIETVLSFLEGEIKAIKAQIQQHIDSTSTAHRQHIDSTSTAHRQAPGPEATARPAHQHSRHRRRQRRRPVSGVGRRQPVPRRATGRRFCRSGAQDSPLRHLGTCSLGALQARLAPPAPRALLSGNDGAALQPADSGAAAAPSGEGQGQDGGSGGGNAQVAAHRLWRAQERQAL